jgi:NTP pyrophosphatase (non-canonical NTP hydrolase)
MTNSIDDLKNKVKEFCEARDWDQFHGPKDLAIGVITEASELLEFFRFLSEKEANELFGDQSLKEDIEDEVADVLFFLLRFCQRFNIDPAHVLIRKIGKLEKKYPVEKAKGSNRKYSKL